MSTEYDELDGILFDLTDTSGWPLNGISQEQMNELADILAEYKEDAKVAIQSHTSKEIERVLGIAVSAIKELELVDYDDNDPYQQGYMWAIGQAVTTLLSYPLDITQGSLDQKVNILELLAKLNHKGGEE